MLINRRESLVGMLAGIVGLLFGKVAQATVGRWRERESGGFVSASGWGINYNQRFFDRQVGTQKEYKSDWPVLSVCHDGFLWGQWSTDHFPVKTWYDFNQGKYDSPLVRKLADQVGYCLALDKEFIFNRPRRKYLRHMYNTDPFARMVLEAAAAHDEAFAVWHDMTPQEMMERAEAVAWEIIRLPAEAREQAMLALKHQVSPEMVCLVKYKMRKLWYDSALFRYQEALTHDYLVPFKVISA
ncbi:MAG: hypothetical protein KGZ65_02570 [Sphingomonadales bacterium]|nr:hypothetical protein [Sphingomonadaceae bacterium]MBS3930089.1 hypothetical protein [Sphingomonadales bacterium]